MTDDDFDLLAMLNDEGEEENPDLVRTGTIVKDEKVQPPPEEVLELHEDGTVTPYKELGDSKSEYLRQITNILSEYEMESNIPVNHLYWKLLNHYRVM